MRRLFLASTLSAGTLLCVSSQVHAQTTQGGLPVSLDRIRDGLSRPPSILADAAPSGDLATPTFHVDIRASPFVLQIPKEKAFDPTFGLPSVGELLMTGIEKAVDYKRHRAERRARQEVADSLAAFCAVRHCSTPRGSK